MCRKSNKALFDDTERRNESPWKGVVGLGKFVITRREGTIKNERKVQKDSA